MYGRTGPGGKLLSIDWDTKFEVLSRNSILDGWANKQTARHTQSMFLVLFIGHDVCQERDGAAE